ASCVKPEFHAGWPQHVASAAKSTSYPHRRSTRTTDAPSCGATVSTTQVGNIHTRSAMGDQYRETAMEYAVYAYYPAFRRLPVLNDADPAFFEDQAGEWTALFEKVAARVSLP